MKNETIKKIVFLVPLCLLFLYALACAFGLTNTFWGWDSRHSSIWWKGLSIAVLLLAGYLFRKWDGTNIRPGQWFMLMTLLAVALMVSTGFKATGGDIKQTITCFQNADGKPSLDGKVNPDCLKEYYNNFYHFDTDTATWRYVNEYKELPGVNHWAFNIREGKTPPSTAPRADEYFKYHTGAYEMDLKENHK